MPPPESTPPAIEPEVPPTGTSGEIVPAPDPLPAPATGSPTATAPSAVAPSTSPPAAPAAPRSHSEDLDATKSSRANIRTGRGRADAAGQSAKPTARRRSREVPANRAQADGRFFFDGFVSLGRVRCRYTEDCGAENSVVDYTLKNLSVRAAPAERPLMRVETARSHGRGDGRRVRLHVVLRPDDAPAVEGDLSLRPGQDLLDPVNFRDTTLEAAFRRVTASLSVVTAEGQPLERLTIVFGGGEVSNQSARVLAMSASGKAVIVDLPLEQNAESPAPAPNAPKPAPPVENLQIFSRGAPPRRLRARRESQLEKLGLTLVTGGGPAPRQTAGALNTVLAGALAGLCESVGGKGCRPGRSRPRTPPPLFVHLLSPRLFVDPEGLGEVMVGCPPGLAGLRGELEIESEIRLGERRRRLAESVTFACDQREKRLTFQLSSYARAQLRRIRRLRLVITVRVFARDGRRAGAVDERTTLRRSDDNDTRPG